MVRGESRWLEVALNGPAGRSLQPNIPTQPADIIAEGIACAHAGAAIIHIHAYDDNGMGVEDADIYREIIEGIRASVDAIVYPTLALSGTPEGRFTAVSALGEEGLLEWSTLDPGSVNITHHGWIDEDRDGVAYGNPDSHIRHGLGLAQRHGWRPSYAIYEPGFIRSGSAWAKRFPGAPTPTYRLMLSQDFAFGMPPSEASLLMYRQMLNEYAPDSAWMISGFGGDILALAPLALELGAHVRVGLEDASLGCLKTNIQLVEEAVEFMGERGFEPATAAQVRADLESVSATRAA